LLTFFDNRERSGPKNFHKEAICICVVFVQATSFNERNAFLVAFQVL